MEKNMSNMKRTGLNANYSVLASTISILFGIIIQKFVIEKYGSEFNGFQSLITSILGYIMIIDGGISLTGKKHLYKPLHDENISEIKKWSNFIFRGYKKISTYLIIFGTILAIVIPFVINYNFDRIGQSIIIFAIVIKLYIEIRLITPMQAMLDADQKSFVFSKYQLITRSIGSIISIIVLVSGLPIYVFVMTLLTQPILQSIVLYTKNKKYVPTVTEKVSIVTNEFKYMIMHKIGGMVLGNVDILYISFLANLTTTSIYGIFIMMTGGLSLVTSAISTSGANQFGQFVAAGKRPDKEYNIYFSINIIITILSLAAFMVAAPFVVVFIGGEEYYNKLFIVLFGINFAIGQFRTTFHQLHYITSEYRRSGKMSLYEAISNLTISTILVFIMKDNVLVAVMIGTIITNFWRLFYDSSLNIRHIIGNRNTMLKVIVSVFVVLIMSIAYWMLFDGYNLNIDIIIKSLSFIIVIGLLVLIMNINDIKSIIKLIPLRKSRNK